MSVDVTPVADSFFARFRFRPVPSKDLPPSIRDFIARYVQSVEQLEIMLLLQRDANTTWTVASTYDVILSTPASVERWLNELAAQGLLTREATTPVTYRYAAPPEIADEVRALVQFYKTTPVRVIEAVYKPRIDAAQSFADAFKLKSPDNP